jgi:hypothetical protein
VADPFQHIYKLFYWRNSVLTWNRFRLLLWLLDVIYSFIIGPGPQNCWRINLAFQLTISCWHKKHYFHMIEFYNIIFGSYRIVIRTRKIVCAHTPNLFLLFKYMFHFSSYKVLLMYKIRWLLCITWCIYMLIVLYLHFIRIVNFLFNVHSWMSEHMIFDMFYILWCCYTCIWITWM